MNLMRFICIATVSFQRPLKMFRLCFFAFLLGVTSAGEVCYSDLGCFDNAPPFTDLQNRPLTMLPEDRDIINTTFALNSRLNPNEADQELLSNQDISTISSSGFDFPKKTKFIIHGYIELGDLSWMMDMVDAILAEGDYNVIRVTWSLKPTGQEHYGKMSSNARIVGAEIALLIDQILTLASAGSAASDPANYHLIGRGLGAHVAGYAGERHSLKLGRISGIDPAGPYFEDMDLIVRLDHTDADFVDVIHTDVDVERRVGLGMDQNIGHADFYPNGGRDQPSCRGTIITAFLYIAGAIYEGGIEYNRCDHETAHEMYLESILSWPTCKFMASPTPDRNIDNYIDGLDAYWDAANAMPMGYHADNTLMVSPTQYHQPYITKTEERNSKPHCKSQYRAHVFFDDPFRADEVHGDLYMRYGANANDWTEEIYHGNTARNNDYEPGSSYYVTGEGEAHVDPLNQLEFSWTYDRDFYNPLTWDFINNPETYVSMMWIDSLDIRKKRQFCTTVEDGKVTAERENVIFLPCY